MKKLAAIMTMVMLALCLGACGASRPAEPEGPSSNNGSGSAEEIRTNFEGAVAYVDALIDTSKMSIQSDEEETTLYRFWTKNEEEAAVLSETAELDGSAITIGVTTAKDLDAMGFDRVERAVEMVAPDEVVSVTVYKGTLVNFLVLKQNVSNEPVPIDELPITEVHAGMRDYTLPFNYCGLTHDSTFADAVNLFGTPSSINLSADDFGTTLELTYYGEEKPDGDAVTTDTLSIAFRYDMATDTTVLTSATLSQIRY